MTKITQCVDCGNTLTTQEIMHPIFIGQDQDWRCTNCHEIAIRSKSEEKKNMQNIEEKKYLTVEEEEVHMQEVYDSLIGDIEEYMFLTPNWINKKRIDLRMLPTL